MYIGKDENEHPIHVSIGVLGWALAVFRMFIVSLLFCIVIVLGTLALVLIETPLLRGRRVLSKHLVKGGTRLLLITLGIKLEKVGAAAEMPGFIVSNHVSWLDICVHIACQNPQFISKKEVGRWPAVNVIAWLIRTIYVERKPTKAIEHKTTLEKKLEELTTITFFPEGGTFYSGKLRPFKPTLFEALFTSKKHDMLYVQPSALLYIPPAGTSAYISQWGVNQDTSLLRSTVMLAAQFRRTTAKIILSDPLKVSDYPDRKALAQAAEDIVRQNLML